MSRFGDEGAKILSASIAFSTTITHLNIAHCNISDDGGEALVKALHTNDACTELNLSFNSLALKTSLAFEKVLVTNQTLQKLDLSHNSFYEDNAIVNFLNGLQQNESLEYLDLSWNALCGEPFGKVLSKSIRLSKLKILKINHNRMGAFELKKLGLGIKYSKTIDEVHLGENLFAEGSDAFLINVFNSESPLTMMSFEKWFHLSQEAFKVRTVLPRNFENVCIAFFSSCKKFKPQSLLLMSSIITFYCQIHREVSTCSTFMLIALSTLRCLRKKRNCSVN